jgi:hypothetical protein
MGGMPGNTDVKAVGRGKGGRDGGSVCQLCAMNKLIGTTYGLVRCDLHETRSVCIKCQRADVLKTARLYQI